MKNYKNSMLDTLIKLQKQGYKLHLTEDGWKVFLNLMNEEIITEEKDERNEGLNVG